VRSRLLDLLATFDFDAAAAVRIGDTGESLRRQTQADGIERGATLDAATGQPFGMPETVMGTARSVPLGIHLHALRPNAEYVSLHTHVHSHSFSEDDIATLLSFPPVRLMTVTGADGTWYLMGRDTEYASDADPPDPEEAVLVFRDALREVLPEFRALSLSGQLAPAQAERGVPAAARQLAASHLGLRYAQVEPGDDDGDTDDASGASGARSEAGE
jgi:hypothetical protein